MKAEKPWGRGWHLIALIEDFTFEKGQQVDLFFNKWRTIYYSFKCMLISPT